jgi:hypothetical protein
MTDAEAASVDQLTQSIKDATLELMKYGLLEASSKSNLYRAALTYQEEVNRVLAPLDLTMKLDDVRGLAYLIVTPGTRDAEDGEWAHPLVRRQRLNLEQSLLIAILRQHYIAHEQELGIGAAAAVVTIEELLPRLQMFLGTLGSDALEQKRLRALLEQLKGYGVVSEVDTHDELTIRPIIVHLANPESLTALLNALRRQAYGEAQS